MSVNARELRLIPTSLAVGALLLGLSTVCFGQNEDAAAFFAQNCTNCHTIGGGRLTGPDLKNAIQRKDRAWLVRYLQNPRAMIDSGDPYAAKLVEEARGAIMPTISDMSEARAQSLLDLIEAESKLPKSRFAGSPISDRPFTPLDVADGRALFMGIKRLKSGGPACISCHTLKGLGGLGGGRLGPDLSLAYERLQGRRGLGAWLINPASPTMQPIFRKHPLQPDEILPLVALFEGSAKRGGADDSAAAFNFFLMGLGGAVLGLITLDASWKGRFRGVRRALVHGTALRGGQ